MELPCDQVLRPHCGLVGHPRAHELPPTNGALGNLTLTVTGIQSDAIVTAAIIVLGVLLGILALLVAALAIVRGVTSATERRRARLLDALRDAVASIAAGLTADLAPSRGRPVSLIWEAVLDSADAIKGPPLDCVATALEATGVLEIERRSVASHSAARRALAVRRLGALALPADRDALSRALRDPAQRVVIAAAEALATWPPDRALAQHIGEAIPETPTSCRTLVATALIRQGALARRPARALARNADAGVRRLGLRVLGMAGAKPGDLVLVTESAIADTDPEVRAAAAEALGRSGLNPGLDAMRRILVDPDWRVQVKAVWAAGRLGDPALAVDLVEHLSSPHWWVRYRSAEALARLGTPGREALAVAARTNPDRYARDAAAAFTEIA